MARRPRYVVHRPQKRPVVARVAELEIERLGARGDGIGQFNGKPVFVPLTLPGEKVLARIEGKRGDGFTATATEWLVQAQDRVKAPCRHFGTCGGCSAQHIKDSSYVAWKRGIAVEALGRVGIPENLIAPLMRVPPGTRRRATFAFKKSRDGLAQDRSTPSQPSDSALNVNPSLEQIDRADSRHQSKPPSGFDFRRPALVLGFNAQASHNIVDILECPLLTPDLTTALPMLRQGLAELFPDAIQGDLMVQATEAGLDVLIVAEAPLDLFRRECLARLVHRPDLAQDRSTKQIARISWQSPAGGEIEPVAERQTPVVILGGIAVTPPPGAFLQPSQEGEAAIAAQVVSGLAGLEGPVLDLYCGIGSFSLPLAAHHAVHAVDGNPAAIAALKRAGEKAGLSRLSSQCRDLAHRPLLLQELDKYSGVVIDPPRVGAREQVIELATARNIQKIVMVSCNPATLARDLAILLDNQWRLDSVVPIDQFLWTPHLEMTALLHRA